MCVSNIIYVYIDNRVFFPWFLCFCFFVVFKSTVGLFFFRIFYAVERFFLCGFCVSPFTLSTLRITKYQPIPQTLFMCAFIGQSVLPNGQKKLNLYVVMRIKNYKNIHVDKNFIVFFSICCTCIVCPHKKTIIILHHTIT